MSNPNRLSSNIIEALMPTILEQNGHIPQEKERVLTQQEIELERIRSSFAAQLIIDTFLLEE